jgi:ATP-dependent Clp protease adaptor protein ClpS
MTKKSEFFDESAQFDNEVFNASSLEEHVIAEPGKVDAKPCMYEVVLLNDDFTPMEYVVFVLKTFFHKAEGEAKKLTMKVHYEGKGICGIYTREVAEMKVLQVENLSHRNSHPLRCVMQKRE